jgi:hypothetical protein
MYRRLDEDECIGEELGEKEKREEKGQVLQKADDPLCRFAAPLRVWWEVGEYRGGREA